MSNGFNEWFSGSKVVDEYGEPKILYHGGQKGITEFGAHLPAEHEKLRKSDVWHHVSAESRYFFEHPVFFFTESPGVAEGYRSYNVEYDDSEVYEVHLALRNPVDLSDGSPASAQLLADLLGEQVQLPAWALEGTDRERSRDIRLAVACVVADRQADVFRAAREKGYDGAIIPDTDVRGRGPYTSYVAFDAAQVRFVSQCQSEQEVDLRASQGELGRQPA